jgi:hypothetical protein
MNILRVIVKFSDGRELTESTSITPESLNYLINQGDNGFDNPEIDDALGFVCWKHDIPRQEIIAYNAWYSKDYDPYIKLPFYF